MGRPSTKSQETCNEILDRIALGEPLAQICRDEHMPSWRTVYDWLAADEAFSAGFARARLHGFDVIAADVLRIADTPEVGVVEKVERIAKPAPQGADANAPVEYEDVVTERRREDMLGHRKLQVEARLKLLAKWDPKRYGERQAIEHAGGLEIEHHVSALTPEERLARIKELSSKLGVSS